MQQMSVFQSASFCFAHLLVLLLSIFEAIYHGELMIITGVPKDDFNRFKFFHFSVVAAFNLHYPRALSFLNFKIEPEFSNNIFY